LTPDDGAVEDRLVLRLRPVYLDDIQVFDPLAPGGFAGSVGDQHHPRLSAMRGTEFLQPLPRGVAPRVIWLRLKSTSVRQIHISVLPESQVANASVSTHLVYSLYVGLVLLIVVWSVVNAGMQRDVVVGSFALMQAAALLYGLTSLGFLRAWWPQTWPASALDTLGSSASLLAVGVSVWFHMRFLGEYRPARWALRGLQALLVISLINAGAVSLGWVRPALQSNMLVILVGPLACMACALTAKVWSQPGADLAPVMPRPVLLAVYAVIVLLLLAASTTALALAPASLQSIYISQVHGLVTGLLMLVMLQYRSYRIARQRQGAELALNRATLQATHEREQREEQEKLLAMLAHEIKTPLATMHMRLGREASPEIRQALREMNSVIERCLQASQTEEGNLQLHPQPLDVADLVREAVASCAHPQRVQAQLPRLQRIHTDRQLVYIVLSNLLDNACKYSAPDSLIQLQIEDAGGPAAGVRLRISNPPGPSGWPDPQQVFDKYYRSPHAQRQAGTGLGLYIVSSVMDKLGGSIAYAPTADDILFVVHLPLQAVVPQAL
jgi:signal transduction histidine kinase